ncbi:filamentous hemagglutinin [Pseudomonas brassicacearum]|uniref:Filamentous hemagglutinin n=1 Tax=Pseudomonas brassicacearum TaxID=930166 RepID=A0AAW8MFP9_9PSED|nr:hemagglutinin repeat-containing protein [Pseudomonas brassicacearum]MDR6960299.1 filamentous hemagglutinin [Pseudomonas brassicacearum]
MDVRTPLSQCIALSLASIVFLNPIVAAAAGLAVDAAAGGNTTIGAAGNGVPVININGTNGSGLSHNKFVDYNVGKNGVILNNATGKTQSTQLGGIIVGNSNLNGQAAQVILNEITSGNRSHMAGYTEVAGQAARVIVANPNGITCSGCGFINTPRATLTTGKPIMEGQRLDRFQVDGGDISIEGAGLDASDVDQFDLITRSAKLNANIYAKNLNVVTGRNDVNADTLSATARTDDGSEKPELAIDSSALGGMYAGAIRLVGTEQGVGVRLAGDMAATTGDIQIDASGKVSMTNASANQAIAVNGQSLDVQGKVYAGTQVNVNTRGDVTVGKSIAARDKISITSAGKVINSGIVEAGVNPDNTRTQSGDVAITAQKLSNTGNVVASRTLEVGARDLIDNQNGIIQGTNVTLSSARLVNQGTTARVLGMSALSLVTPAIVNLGGLIRFGDGQSTTLNLDSLDNTDGHLELAGGSLALNAKQLTNLRGSVIADQLQVTAQRLDNQRGLIASSVGQSIIKISDQLDNTNGVLQAQSLLDISADHVVNQGGKLVADHLKLTTERLNNSANGLISAELGNNELTVTQELNNQGGRIQASSALTLKTGSTNNTSGVLVAQQLTLVSQGALNNQQGKISADQLAVSAQDVDNTEGLLQGTGVATLTARDLNNLKGNINGGQLTADLGSLSQNAQGVLSAETSKLTMVVARQLNNSAGHLQSKAGDLDITTDGLNNQQGVIVGKQLLLTQSGLLDNRGGRVVGDQLTLVAGRIDNSANGLLLAGTGGALLTLKDQGLTPGQLLNTQGRVQSDGHLQVNGSDIDNHGGVLLGSSVGANAAHLDNSAQGSVIATGGAIGLAVSGVLNNALGLIDGGESSVLVTQAARIDNQGGTLTGKRLDIQGTAVDNRKGQLLSGVDGLKITATSVDNSAGLILAQAGHADLQLSQGTLDNQGGALQGSSVEVVAASANNSALAGKAGLINAQAGDLKLLIDNLTNQAGRLYAQGLLSSQGQTLDNRVGGEISARTLSLNALNTYNQTGLIESGGNLLLTGGNLHNSAGRIRAIGGDMSQILLTGALNNQNGSIGITSQAATLKAGALNNLAGNIEHAGTGLLKIDLTSLTGNQGSITGLGSGDVDIGSIDGIGRLQLNGALDVVVGGNVDLLAGDRIASANRLSLSAATLNNSGEVLSDGDLGLVLSGDLNNNGLLSAAKAVSLSAGNLTQNNGSIASAGNTTLTLRGNLDNLGRLIANQNLNIHAAQVTNRGTLGAMGQLDIFAGNGISTSANTLVYSGGDMNLRGATLSNHYGDIYSKGNLSFAGLNDSQAQSLSNRSANIESEGDMNLNVASLENTKDEFEIGESLVSRRIDINCTDCSGKHHTSTFIVNSTYLGKIIKDSPGARLIAGRDLLINAGTVENKQSLLAANRDAFVNATNFYNRGATLDQRVESTTYFLHDLEQSDFRWAESNANAWNAANAGSAPDQQQPIPTAITQYPIIGQSSVVQKGTQTGSASTLQSGRQLNLIVTGNLENGTLTQQAQAQLTGQNLANTVGLVGGQTITVNALGSGGSTQVAADVRRVERVSADGSTQVSFVPVDFAGVPFVAVDPTALGTYRLPEGDYGLFVRSQNPDSRYLIETNPNLTNLSRFMSSDYMFGQLGYNDDRSWRRLGDGLYETRLIREAVLAQTGQRFLAASLTSDYDQYQYLMDNAIASKDALQLSVGVALTSQQVAALTHDIVWMETRRVQGQDVLVPVLYLAQVESRNLRGGSLVQARDINLMAGNDLTNVGTLRASNDLTAEAGNNLYQGGLAQASERVSLMAQNSIRNALGGEVRGNQVDLNAVKGDIVNERAAMEVLYGSGSRTNLDQGSLISARQQLNVSAGRDLTNKGQIHSDGNASLSAGRDVDMLAVQDHTFTQNAIRRGLVTNDTVKTLGSSVTTGGDLKVNAGRDMAVVASQVKAGHDMALNAGNDMAIVAGQDEQSSTFFQKKKGSWGKSKTTQSADSATANVASQIEAGHDLTVNITQDKDGRIGLNGGRDVTVVGSQLKAGNDLLVGGSRDVNLMSAQEQADSSYSVKKKGSFGLSKSGSSSSSSSVTQVGSELNAGNDAVVVAGGNVNVSASRIDAKRDAELRAGMIDKNGDVNLMDAANESTSHSEKYKSKVGFSTSGNFISIASAKKSGQENLQTQSVGSQVTGGRDVTVQSIRDVNMIGSSAEAGRHLQVGAGRDVNVLAGSNSQDQSNWKSQKQSGLSLESDRNGFTAFAGREATKTKSRDAQQTAAGSQLVAGQDVTVKAGRDLTLEGAGLDAGRDISLQASRDINVDAVDETFIQERSKTRDRNGLTVNISHNYGNTMDAINGTGKGEDNVSKASSVLSTVDAINSFTSGPTSATHFGSASQGTSSRSQIRENVPSTLSAGRDINAVAGNDLNVRGSQFEAGRDITLVGKNVNLDVARGTIDQESQTTRSQGGINGQSGGGSGRAGIGGSNGVASEETTQGTNTPSVLLSGRDTNIEATENLTMIGTQVIAGKDIDLRAGKDLTIRAAQNDSDSESTRRSGGGEVGLALGGKDFIAVYASVDMGKGKLERETEKQQTAYLYAGNQLRFNSGNDTTIAGANLRGDEVVGRVGGDLLVSSVPDTGKVSGKQFDASVTVSIGVAGGGGVSGSVGVGKTTGKTNWVEQQTSITGKNGVDIRTEKHTQIDGALIAADNGKLKLDTNTLGFRDINGVDKEHSYYVNVGGAFGWGADAGNGAKATGGKDVAFTSDKSLSGAPKEGFNGWSVSGYDYRKDREQDVRATVGAGNIIVRNDAVTGQNSTGGLNRDPSKAYDITRDKEKRTDLYISESSLNSVGSPMQTLDRWKKGLQDYGKNSSDLFKIYGELTGATEKALEENPGLAPLAWIPGVMQAAMDKTSYGTLGLMPGVISHGGVATQLPVLLSGDMSFYRTTVVYQKDTSGKVILDPDGKPLLDLKDTKFDMIVRPDAPGVIAINGIQNSLQAAAVNGSMQGGKDSFMQGYNPEHGFLGDLVESLWDVALGSVKRSGNAQQVSEFYQAGVDQGFRLDLVGHSQGALITYRGIDGVSFGNSAGGIQLSGAPVYAQHFFDAAQEAGFNIDGNNAVFQVNRPDSQVFFGMLPMTDSVSDFLGNNALNSSDPISRYLGALFTMPGLMGKDSPHSNYLCQVKSMCQTGTNQVQQDFKNGTTTNKDGTTKKIYIVPTFIDKNGNAFGASL